MKKSKLKKRIIIAVICVVLVAAAVIAVIYARQNTGKAFVQSVGDLDASAYMSGDKFNGNVVESAQMKVLADTEKKISEIYVSQGDKVKKGDKLFMYDPTLLELTVEDKQLSVKNCENALTAAQDQLVTYQNIVPYEEPATETPTEAPQEEEGTQAEDAQVTEEPVDEEPQQEEPTEEEKHYTAGEKADLIAEQQLNVKKAQTALESANEELNEAKKDLQDATVIAQLDGTVTQVQSIDSLVTSTPVCTVTGDSGVTVKCYIDEFNYNDLKIGDNLSVTSWMSDANAVAEILSIGDYPVENNMGGEGNPNTSYYEVTAFLEQNDGFDIGEDVQISLISEDDGDDSIIISKMYVRTDTNGSYVLKDDGGKLARQNVSTKKLTDGDYVMITDGLTKDDMIAFPYGSKGKVGIKTTTEQQGPSIF